jgi:hypothetical protein
MILVHWWSVVLLALFSYTVGIVVGYNFDRGEGEPHGD